MIVCFDCSPGTKSTLDSLLESGQYGNYGEIISLAVSNLAVLEGEIEKGGDLVIGTRSGRSIMSRKDATERGKESPQESAQQYEHDADPAGIPAIFRLEELPESSPPFVDMPDDVWAIGQEIPIDRWVFGQYNRLLPAKASCRALAHLVVDEPTGVLLEEAAERIAEEAAVLGQFLARHDREHEIGRDKTLSTAFPSANKETSLQRFATQFVASVNRQGQMSGLLVDLKLVNGRGARETRFMLTDVGWEFATMPNPVFDGMQDRPTQKFSENERDFLLNHIARAVPVEDFAYRAVLTAIQEGAETPDAVGLALRQYIPRSAEGSFSESFLSSQRSGAISRMTDLDLVERVRDGVRVSYVVTDIGRRYLQRRKGASLGEDQSKGVPNGQ